MGDADVFDVITAVNDGPIPREARPTNAIKALDAIPSGAAEPIAIAHAGTPKTMHVIAEPVIEEWNGPEAAAEPVATTAPEDVAVVVDSAGEITVEPAVTAIAEPIEARESDATRDGRASDSHDALAIPHERAESHDDRIARARGLPPIAEPYVRDPSPLPRGWLYASIGVSLACVVVTAGVVLWARAEVEAARAAGEVQPVGAMTPVVATKPVVAMKPVESAPAATPLEQPAAANTEATIEPAQPCALRVSASVRGATVWIDGVSHGSAPAELPLECRRETVVEVRHPRYEHFKRTLAADGGMLEIDARLERAKTELTVWSDPAGATVTYNGHPLGQTPLVTKVNRFEQGTLRFRAPGMGSDWRKIVPKEPAKTVSITLKPRS